MSNIPPNQLVEGQMNPQVMTAASARGQPQQIMLVPAAQQQQMLQQQVLQQPQVVYQSQMPQPGQPQQQFILQPGFEGGQHTYQVKRKMEPGMWGNIPMAYPEVPILRHPEVPILLYQVTT